MTKAKPQCPSPNQTAGPSAFDVKTLRSIFGTDYDALTWCVNWRVARAETQKSEAESDLRNGWGRLGRQAKVDHGPLDKMQEIEKELATVQPQTLLLAQELLGICVTILNHKGEAPDSILAHGPILRIVENVREGLFFLERRMPMAPQPLANWREVAPSAGQEANLPLDANI